MFRDYHENITTMLAQMLDQLDTFKGRQAVFGIFPVLQGSGELRSAASELYIFQLDVCCQSGTIPTEQVEIPNMAYLVC